MRQKRPPMRMCTGCGEMKPKKDLILVVLSPEGAVSLDFRGKLPGRGAYLCPDPNCLARAKKSRALERAFSAALPQEVYAALEEQMKEVDFEARKQMFKDLEYLVSEEIPLFVIANQSSYSMYRRDYYDGGMKTYAYQQTEQNRLSFMER